MIIEGKGPDGLPKTAALDADGKLLVSGGSGGGGDASAANQLITHTKLDTLDASIGGVGADVDAALRATPLDMAITGDLPDTATGDLAAMRAALESGGATTIEALPHANLGAFGDLETMELRPLLQLSFATGLRDQLIKATVANGGTVIGTGGKLQVASGTNAAGSAIAESVKPASYRPGQGITLRFTPFWPYTAPGFANHRTYAGAGNAVDGYFIGWNGASFGVCHRLNSVDTWTAQSAWNGDPCNGTGPSSFTFDPSKGSPIMIKWPYLGHGNIRFYILNPTTSLWVLAHTIQYSNSSATPQLTNPCLGFYAQSINTGSTSNSILHITCAAILIDGEPAYLGPQFGTESSKANITTETNLLTLRNATSINGVANRGLMRVRQISVGTDSGNGLATLRVKRGATLGGTPAYAAISGTTADGGVTLTSAQSTGSVDVAGTTVTGGTTLYNATIGRLSAQVIDLTPFGIFIPPGETLTFSVSSAASANISVAVNWNEDVQ